MRITKVIALEDNEMAIPMEVLVRKQTEKCFICNEVRNDRLTLDARADFYIKTNIFIPGQVRCCANHLTECGYVKLEFMENIISIPSKIILSGKDISTWFSILREITQHQSGKKYEDENNFSDAELKSLTSLNREQFSELFDMCGPVEMNGCRRYLTKKYLMAFLMKLRQGLSDNFLCSILNFSSRQNMSMAISVVRQSLMARFVNENLGFNSPPVQDRERFLEQHMTEFVNRLYNPDPAVPKAILYPDCTYLKIPKSSQFRVQRQSYSSHKKYTLLKAGLVVAPDGFIVSVHGPYFADVRNNDARILINEFNQDREQVRNWVRDNDIFVLDRGYRDAVEFLEALHLNCEMPSFLARGQRQFSTEEANQSRKVTKTRWIVESGNGHLKSIFKFFRDCIPMQHCLHLDDFLKIACALINRFHEPIHMQNCDDDLARAMLNIIQNQTINQLQIRVEQERLHRRGGVGVWVNLNENNDYFPHLPLDYIASKTFGSYQVKISAGYIQDTSAREVNNEFIFQTQLLENNLIRARVYSRFTQATKHMLFIEYNENIEDPITGTYCTCKSGARTLGVCAHVACVLWYLGYARHENQVKYPTDVLLRSVQDAANRHNNVEIVENMD